MTNTIQPAGFIVTDNELIHSVGDTADAAWSAAVANLALAGIKVISDDADSEAELGGWTREGGLHIRSASAALIADVEGKGSAIGWHMRGGVCCTRDEAEA